MATQKILKKWETPFYDLLILQKYIIQNAKILEETLDLGVVNFIGNILFGFIIPLSHIDIKQIYIYDYFKSRFSMKGVQKIICITLEKYQVLGSASDRWDLDASE